MILRSSIKKVIDVLKQDTDIDEFQFYQGDKSPDLVAIRRILAYIIIQNSKTTTTRNLANYFNITTVAVKQGNQIVALKLEENKDYIFIELYNTVYRIMVELKLIYSNEFVSV